MFCCVWGGIGGGIRERRWEGVKLEDGKQRNVVDGTVWELAYSAVICRIDVESVATACSRLPQHALSDEGPAL